MGKEIINGEGNLVKKFDGNYHFSVRTDSYFVVYRKGVDSNDFIIEGPDNVGVRHYQCYFYEGEELEFTCAGRYTITLTPINPRSEKPYGEKLVETFGIDKPTHADLERAILLEKISQLTEERGGESIDESDDFEIEDDDTPLTPYEYDVMATEYLQEAQQEAVLNDDLKGSSPDDKTEESDNGDKV